jgi:hypothetical protein
MIRKVTDNSRGIRLGNYVQIRTIEDEELEQVWAGKKTGKQALDAIVSAATNCWLASSAPTNSKPSRHPQPPAQRLHWALRANSKSVSALPPIPR